MSRLLLLAALALGLAACEVDDETAAFCADSPVVTYENFGAGFLTQNCDSCHASTTADRQEAPDDVVFDSEDEALVWGDRILARAAADDADMPPEGGVAADDRYLLEVWLVCSE